MNNVLNLGAGKFDIKALEDFGLEFDKWDTLVHLDTMFKNIPDAALDLSDTVNSIENNSNFGDRTNVIRCFEDVFFFLENCPIKFNEIFSARFFEHIGWSQLNFFLYLVADSMVSGGKLDIIVPNYKTLATRILDENVNHPDFEKENIVTTTELLNEPGMPHASIWTPDRAKYYLEYEGRFVVDSVQESFELDGRDIYMRVIARRV
ncbi:MAG: hypothetical protein KAS32_20200 [Candidatus Peribacteraceae bacterium]|nr:hypothetical protein [Candidatus Peribacteraceae bacterium]